MEFVEGETLENLIKRFGRLEVALEIATEVAASVRRSSYVQFRRRHRFSRGSTYDSEWAYFVILIFIAVSMISSTVSTTRPFSTATRTRMGATR